MRKNQIILLLIISAIVPSQMEAQTNWNDTLSPKLIIRSGFEADTAIYNMNANILGFQGVDQSVAPPYSWKGTNFYPDIGNIYCQLGSPGSVRDRSVSIVNDPQNSTNHALMFQINNATERGSPVKGRVSMNIGENKGLKEIYYKVRLMLPSDFGYLRDYTFKPGNWLTLMEFWENPDWTVPAPYPFRVTLYVVNSPDHAHLNFGVEAQTMDPDNWKSIWRIQNKSFNLPFDEWFTMEVYYKEGDSLTGRFYLSVTRSDANKSVIFDVKDYTYHPSNPTPAGLRYINPMKLYCSKSVVDWVSNRQPQGGVLRVYWDDFELWKNKNPSEQRP